jgi:pyruvate/2-oxoglutarate dehydrogenase complex dihydrolipoamide dehydrogenase (E3) component
MSTPYDAIIIGTGQAGPSLATRLAGAGWKVAIIERGAFGGTCVNTGCIPTKTLIASAYAAHLVRRAAEYGISTGPVAVNMKKVKARKDAIVGETTRSLETSLRATPGCTVYTGHARFESPREVRVGSELLTAEKIFVNVGGRASVPPIPGLSDVAFLNNSSMMHLDFAPPHLVILGGSYVGLEFAQMYSRFGSAVTVLETSPRLIPREDQDISAAVRDVLEREGIAVRTGVRPVAVEKTAEGVRVRIEGADGAPEVGGTHLLLAAGRRPNTDDLGLDKAGVRVDARGDIVVDDALRTTAAEIWALGDCNGRGAFTHTAYNDFEIVAANLLDDDPRRVTDRIVAYALYTDPPLGRAGMTEAEARKAGRNILVGRRPMTKVRRAVEKGEDLGFMKVVVDADSKAILGAAILGVGGDEVIHSLLDVMYAKAPYTVIQRAVHIHPTISELVPTMLGELEPA